MLIADYGRFKLYPEDKFEGVRRPRMSRKPSHTDDWVQACKTNEPLRPGTNFSYSGPLTETVLLGIVAFRTGEKNNRYNFPAESVTTLVIKESGIRGRGSKSKKAQGVA